MTTAANKHIYIIGIKGVGMTALAQVFQARGYDVSGSDVSETFFTDDVLRKAGIKVLEGFAAENVPEDVAFVVHSTAYGDTHVEIAEARAKNLNVLSYPQALGRLFDEYEGIAVAGTHGKTTTTAMIGAILQHAERSPTVIVGSAVRDFHGNALLGHSKLFVAETDEYQNKFTQYRPHHLVLNNIEYDHPDFFHTEQEYIEAFRRFLHTIPQDGICVVNGDDPIITKLRSELSRPFVLFGKHSSADVKLLRTEWRDNKQQCVVQHAGDVQTISLNLPGEHNALNACAAAALCISLNVSWDNIAAALAKFNGIARRFEIRGEYNGAVIVDDYAHHPTELRAAIAAAYQHYPGRRVLAVFHPHTYSRTKALLDDFADALQEADTAIVLDIYGSAREQQGTVSTKELLLKIPTAFSAHHIATCEEVAEYLRTRVGKRDVVLLLGAGDVWRVADLLMEKT